MQTTPKSHTYTEKSLIGYLGSGDDNVKMFRDMADKLTIKGSKSGDGIADENEIKALIKKYDKNGDGRLTVERCLGDAPAGQKRPLIIDIQ